MSKILLWLLISFIAACSSISTGLLIKQDYRLYSAESKCVAVHIAKGIERSDIITANGTCWVRK